MEGSYLTYDVELEGGPGPDVWLGMFEDDGGVAVERAGEVDPVDIVGVSASEIGDGLTGEGGTSQEDLDSGYSGQQRGVRGG